MNNETVRYRHIRLEHYGITVAYYIMDDELRMGFSFCSPQEKHYEKAKGRELAVQRLAGTDCVKVKLTLGGKALSKLIFNNGFLEGILEEYSRKHQISWLRRMLN